MLAHDVRVELPLAEDVQAAGRAGTREHVRGRVDTAPLRPSNEPGKIVDLNRGRHGILTRTAEGAGLLGDLAIPSGFRRWIRPRGWDASAPYQTFPPGSAARELDVDVLGSELVPRANLRRATAWQDQLFHESFHELEAVSQGHLADAGDFRNRLLRTTFPGRQGGQVDGRRGGPRRREGHRAVDLRQFFEDLLAFRLPRVAQTSAGHKPAHIVGRNGPPH